MRLYGLGDTSSCGANPCGWGDLFGAVFTQVSQPCAQYVLCATPQAVASSAEQTASGALTGGVPAQDIAYGGGWVAQKAAQEATNIGAQALSNFAAGIGGGEVGSISNTIVSAAMVVAAVLGAVILVPALLRR